MTLDVVVVTTTPSISNFLVRFRVFFFRFIRWMSSFVSGVSRFSTWFETGVGVTGDTGEAAADGDVAPAMALAGSSLSLRRRTTGTMGGSSTLSTFPWAGVRLFSTLFLL